jgi:hypothetical protein
MRKPHKGKFLPLRESIHWEDLDGWIRIQINDTLKDPVNGVIRQVLDHLDEFVKFPKKSVLLWKGCDRVGSATKKHEYPKDLKEALDKRGVVRDVRSNGPAITSFLFAGGERPARNQPSRGWNIHHLYDGKITYCGRQTSLHSVKEGNHFTQSAGLVAVHPVADALCDDVPAFSWYLRGLSLQMFGYDPDGVFPGGRIDDYGFLQSHKTTVVYGGKDA